MRRVVVVETGPAVGGSDARTGTFAVAVERSDDEQAAQSVAQIGLFAA